MLVHYLLTGILGKNAGAGSDINGSLSKTLDPITLSSTATLAIQGSLSATIAPITLSSTGALAITATETTTLGAVTLSATGSLAITGSLTATLDAVTLSSDGTVEQPPVVVETAQPGGGYAPWEHGKINKARERDEKRKRQAELDTIAELEAAYDKAQGIAQAVEAIETPAEAENLSTALSVAKQAIQRAAVAQADHSAEIDALLASLQTLAAEIQQRILEDEDDDDFLLMVA